MVETAGNLEGSWDRSRIQQILSILIGSAVQHGLEGSEITVAARAGDQEIFLSVHSEGVMAPDAVATFFDPLLRGLHEKVAQSDTARLNLGLFISMGIAAALLEESRIYFDTIGDTEPPG